MSVASPSLTITSGEFDTDDGITMRVAGEAHPRVRISPQGTIETGDGDAAPASAGGISWGAWSAPVLPAIQEGVPAWADVSGFGLPPLKWSENSSKTVEWTGGSIYGKLVSGVPTPETPPQDASGIAIVLVDVDTAALPRSENNIYLPGESFLFTGPTMEDRQPTIIIIQPDGSMYVRMADPLHNAFSVSGTYAGSPE